MVGISTISNTIRPVFSIVLFMLSISFIEAENLHGMILNKDKLIVKKCDIVTLNTTLKSEVQLSRKIKILSEEYKTTGNLYVEISIKYSDASIYVLNQMEARTNALIITINRLEASIQTLQNSIDKCRD